MNKIEQEDDGRKGTFKLYLDNEAAGELTYTWAGDNKFIIDFTTVHESYNGKGLGKQLVKEAVEFARKKDLKILPLCPFAKRMIDINKEWHDVKF